MAGGGNIEGNGMVKPGFYEVERNVSCLGDDWQLVRSHSSSSAGTMPDGPGPPPEGAACSSGSLLDDDYFGCPSSVSEFNAVPLSTSMAPVESEEDACSSTGSDGLISQEPYTKAIEDHTRFSLSSSVSDEDKENIDTFGSIRCQYDDEMLHENVRLADSTCHDVHSNHLLLEKDTEGIDADVAVFNLHNDAVINQVDGLPAVNDSCKYAYELLDENNGKPTVTSIGAVSALETDCSGQQLRMPEVLESSSVSMTMQGGVMEEHCSSSEGGSSSVVSGGASRQTAGQLVNSVDRQASVTNSGMHKNFKVRACASWLWTQICRWQAQLGYANAIWSMAFTAAMVGILFLRRGLQRLQAQNYSLRSQLWAKEKRITLLLFQLMQAKVVSSRVRRVPVICTKPPLQVSHGHT